MTKFLGIEYGRGATKNINIAGPALAPRVIQSMFPKGDWTIVTPDPLNILEITNDRFGENYKIQQKIYKQTPYIQHIMIGGDHSVNFGHFAAIADHLNTDDLCLVYIDAHLDLHTPDSSKQEASGAPHGTNVRALLGEGDSRWLGLPRRCPVLHPENLFYIATRSFEPAEKEYALKQNININFDKDIKKSSDLDNIIHSIRQQIGSRPYIVSFDFDAIDPKYFSDVLVPESGGITFPMAKKLVKSFRDAYSFEFVEYSPTGNQKSRQIAQSLINILYQEKGKYNFYKHSHNLLCR
ncbi:MAG: arginase family protein [Alphaproteobacteria bacterium]|nr:arginase family protein [Alphaproteobacteria bacterium]